ncbi:unnamed protein product, partial [Polarella glacialis]
VLMARFQHGPSDSQCLPIIPVTSHVMGNGSLCSRTARKFAQMAQQCPTTTFSCKRPSRIGQRVGVPGGSGFSLMVDGSEDDDSSTSHIAASPRRLRQAVATSRQYESEDYDLDETLTPEMLQRIVASTPFR